MQWTTWFAIAPGLICLVCLRERLRLVQRNYGIVRRVLAPYLRERSLYRLARSSLASADHFGKFAGWKKVQGWFHGLSIDTGWVAG
jgi:hypothetical protein